MNKPIVRWLLIVGCGSIVYLATTVILIERAKLTRHKEDTSNYLMGRPENAYASWNFNNPELEQLITELKKEKEMIAKRQNELNEVQSRLTVERAELNQLTQTVWQLQMDLEKDITRIKEEEMANLKKLARIYSSMTPETAANILKELPDDVIVKVLSIMKENESAPILELISKGSQNDYKRAALLTEKIRLVIQKTAANKNANQ